MITGVRITKFHLRLAQALYLSFASVLALAIQSYAFPLAGKKIEDRSSTYSYQLNVWTNEVFNRFEEISKSGMYERITFTQPRTINVRFINDVAAYHAQMQNVLRILGYQGLVLVRINEEMMPLIKTVLPTVSDKRRADITNNLRQLAAEAERQQKIMVELAEFNVQLRAAYLISKSSHVSASQSVDVMVKQVKAISALGTNPRLLLGKDPFNFIRNFGKAQEGIFADYQLLVEEHNRLVAEDEFRRDLSLMILAIVTGCLMLNAELKVARTASLPPAVI